jgi:phosphate starvation-inducible protein PhoH
VAKAKKNVSLSTNRDKSKMIPSVTAANVDQKNALRAIAAQENHIVFVDGIAGVGKAQPMDSLVLTPRGFIPMRDVKIGQVVSTPNGETASVVGVFPQGKLPIYAIEFKGGDSVQCCKDHLWSISSNANFNKKWQNVVVNTEFLIDNLEYLGRKHLTIRLPEPVFFESRKILIDPYVMGILIGDGCLTQAVTFSTADEEVLSAVQERLPSGISAKHRSKYDFGITSSDRSGNSVLDAIKHYHLHGVNSYSKFIPQDFLLNDVETRLELLRGLMDSDGWVEKNGTVQFCTVSSQLIEQFKWLIESLGGLFNFRKTTKKCTVDGKVTSVCEAYVGTISINRGDLFKLPRKLNRCKIRSRYFPKRQIVGIKEVKVDDAQCIMLDSKEKLYITDNFVVTHNTYLAASWGLGEMMKGHFDRIIVTRPYVEAGERLGYLPGSFDCKIAPFMIPIFDSFRDHITKEDMDALAKNEKIVTLPLAYMRGVTFKKAFVLLDEAQNTTISQMHLFLTRIGEGSKVVITGDVSQSDLGPVNGFADALGRLEGVKGLEIIRLSPEFVVRHSIIPEIDKRYKL